MNIEELRRLHEQATPEPWGWKEDETSPGYYPITGSYKNICMMQHDHSDLGMDNDPSKRECEANAALIVAMRNSLPELLAKAETHDALVAENERLRDALKPFAAVAEHDIGEDETDDDIFWPISNARYSMSGRLRVGHIRAALEKLGGRDVD